MRSAIGRLVGSRPCPSEDATAFASHEDYFVCPAEDDAEWEAQLLRHPSRNVYLSCGWGAYKARLGWTVERLFVRSGDGTCLGMAQVQRYSKLGLQLIYIHGGPLFFTSDDTVTERGLETLLAHLDPGRFGFLIVNYERFDTPAAVMALLTNRFDPILNRAHHTLVIDTADGLDALRRRLRRNRAKQLRKGLANTRFRTRIVTSDRDRRVALDAFAGMYTTLAVRKRFAEAVDIDAFRETLIDDQRFVMLEVRDGDHIVAVRIAHVGADRLTDFFVASDESALNNGVNTLAVWRMIEYTAKSGLRYYDAGGFDPVASPGVARFKRGLAGSVVQSGPLWLFDRSRVVRFIVGVSLVL